MVASSKKERYAFARFFLIEAGTRKKKRGNSLQKERNDFLGKEAEAEEQAEAEEEEEEEEEGRGGRTWEDEEVEVDEEESSNKL